jgi:hypothetical protein
VILNTTGMNHLKITKEPLNLFFADSEIAENKKEIYNIKHYKTKSYKLSLLE